MSNHCKTFETSSNFQEGTFSDNRKFATKSSKKTQYVSDIYLSRSPRRQNSENYLGFPHNSFLHQFQIKTLLLRAFPLYFLFVFHYFERWQQQNNLSLSNFENNFSEKIRRIIRFLWFSGNLDFTSSNSPLDWTSSQSP